MSEKKVDEECSERQINYPDIMCMSEAAAYMAISKCFLYMLVRGGFVPYAKIGKRIVFRKQDLYDWIGSNVIEPVNFMTYEDEDDTD